MDKGGVDASAGEPHPLVLQGVDSVVAATGYPGVTMGRHRLLSRVRRDVSTGRLTTPHQDFLITTAARLAPGCRMVGSPAGAGIDPSG